MAMNNGTEPQNLVRQLLNNSNPAQLQSVLSQAKQWGVPDDILSQVQNMK